MTSVYINYPNPHFSVEHGRTVEDRVRHDKPDRRVFKINLETFREEIGRFQRGEVRFVANHELNDLWLELDFGDEAFEKAIVQCIQRLLGKRYLPLAHAPWR